MFRYFWIGFEKVWALDLFKNANILLIAMILLLCFRRGFVVWKSGGSFFLPYHIENGNLYIHSAMFFGKRIIPLREIKSIETHYFRGKMGRGKRYILLIEKKHGNGKRATVMFGKTKKTDQLVSNLQKETKKYGIKIHKGLWMI